MIKRRGDKKMTFVIGERHMQMVQTSLANNGLMASKEESFEALLRASLIGHTAAVEALLDSGLDVNAKGQNAWTPLLEAVFGGHTDTIRVLLDRGADVNATDQTGWTPLMEAASKGRSEVVKILLAYGADANARTIKSWTALYVTPKRNSEIVSLLKQAHPAQSATAR
jgi:ankyrin repeat protein